MKRITSSKMVPPFGLHRVDRRHLPCPTMQREATSTPKYRRGDIVGITEGAGIGWPARDSELKVPGGTILLLKKPQSSHQTGWKMEELHPIRRWNPLTLQRSSGTRNPCSSI
ncbi:hypothetical protein [Methanosphaerula subterraneus]|uniref:hypothetical protein n=1 Tax=Methanosphaerula subterraneus TaxID=3350244 RepID=UPI003F856F9D